MYKNDNKELAILIDNMSRDQLYRLIQYIYARINFPNATFLAYIKSFLSKE